jgi:Putative 2OG-Fe(II) oxygenase
MFKIESMFAVPMAFGRLDDCATLNAELEALLVGRAAEGERYRNPRPIVDRNPPVFESSFQLFDWPHDGVRRLRDFCWSALYGLIGELSGYDNDTLARLHMSWESWFHVTRPGGYFGLHNHALHSWSGVYCVRHDSDEASPMSGRLSFPHPNATAAMYVDMGNFKLRPPYAMGPLNLRLKPGELVLFPSWLLHQVLPYEGSSPRITVAFNACFRLDGELPVPATAG